MFIRRRRIAPSLAWQFLSPPLAITLALATGYLFLTLQDLPAQAILLDFLISPLSDFYSLVEIIGKATPLLICALGLSICYRAKIWNIGAEGQFIAGALIGGAVALHLDDWPSWQSLPTICMAGIAAGSSWAGISAWLKVSFKANEVLTTIMLNYISLHLLAWSLSGPLKDPEGFNFPESALFADSVMLPSMLEDGYLSIGALVALLLTVLLFILNRYSILLFRFQLLGEDEGSARFSGLSPKRLTLQAMAISGGLAGLAGIMEIAGPVGQLTMNVNFGFGYAAIIVAFLGRLKPMGMLFASLLMSITYLGAENVQIGFGIPRATTSIFQGALLLYLLATDFFINFEIRIARAQPE